MIDGETLYLVELVGDRRTMFHLIHIHQGRQVADRDVLQVAAALCLLHSEIEIVVAYRKTGTAPIYLNGIITSALS